MALTIPSVTKVRFDGPFGNVSGCGGVGENEHPARRSQVRTALPIRDVVGPPPENECARLLVHQLHLIEVRPGLAFEHGLRCSSLPEKYQSKMRMPLRETIGSILP